MSNSNSNSGTKGAGAGIKPGSLCLVSVPSDWWHPVVRSGMVVTAVEYKGTDIASGGKLLTNTWQITNPELEAYIARKVINYIGCPAQWLIPISDPDVDTSTDVADTQRQKRKLQLADMHFAIYQK